MISGDYCPEFLMMVQDFYWWWLHCFNIFIENSAYYSLLNASNDKICFQYWNVYGVTNNNCTKPANYKNLIFPGFLKMRYVLSQRFLVMCPDYLVMKKNISFDFSIPLGWNIKEKESKGEGWVIIKADTMTLDSIHGFALCSSISPPYIARNPTRKRLNEFQIYLKWC